MTKQELRKIYQEKRKAFSLSEIASSMIKMQAQFNSLHLPKSDLLLSYKAMDNKRELDPFVFEKELANRNPNLKIAYPVSNLQSCTMQAYRMDSDVLFVKNKWGISEPETKYPVAAQDIDIMFVPLLAFDLRGYRVGYGKGFYDRYLTLCKPDILKIGFSFFQVEELISDINSFDQLLDFVITPEKTYAFSK